MGRESKGKLVYSREKSKMPPSGRKKQGQPYLHWSIHLVHKGRLILGHEGGIDGLVGLPPSSWASFSFSSFEYFLCLVLYADD